MTDRDGTDDIYLLDLDGSNPTLLVGGPGDEFQSSFSGDMSHVVFDSDRSGNWELYTVRANGTDLTRITDNPALDDLPVWRP